MILKTIRHIVIVLTLMLLSGGAGYWLANHNLKFVSGKITASSKITLPNYKIVNTTAEDNTIDFSLFWQVWDKLQEKFLDKTKLDKRKMFYGAIQGMTSSLGDPYTVFLPPTDNKQIKEDLNGSFEGVGISLGYKDGNKLVVMTPLRGSPAEAVGVKKGDAILHIKDITKDIDQDTQGITLPDAVEKIRGPKGSIITLTLQHENEAKPYQVDIKREPIVVPSVEVEFLKGSTIADLKLSRFGDLTSDQWDDSVNKILSQKTVKGMILDLRGNPGGYLSGAVNLASEFLQKGVIVQQENYQGDMEKYSVGRRGKLVDMPLVVLIDKGSASASEILAGAIQDYKRGKLIGTTSFGKGTIQETEDLPAGAGLHITTAKWLTPNGTWIDKKGLKPDIEQDNDPANPQDDKQLNKAIEVLEESL